NKVIDVSSLATTSARGIIELATTSEVISGTDNTKAVTPKTLKDYQQDTGWIIITSGFLSGFTNNGTAGKLSYRINDGIVYWRGGADGVFPSGQYTKFVQNLPIEAMPDVFMRFGATGSGANPTFVEISPAGY